MAKKFNITGTCTPEKHYMVNLNNKLVQIKKLIDDEKYFTINRGRQYGKTTTLTALEKALIDDYLVISISFEEFDEASFSNAKVFCQEFLIAVDESLEILENPPIWYDDSIENFRQLSRHITKMCGEQKVILMIDEVDKVIIISS